MSELEKRFEEIKLLKDPKEICYAIIGTCMYSGNYEFSLKICDYFINYIDTDVRRNCITCLSIIGVTHKKIDYNIANKILNIGLNEPELIGDTKSIILDLEHNVKNYKFKKE